MSAKAPGQRLSRWARWAAGRQVRAARTGSWRERVGHQVHEEEGEGCQGWRVNVRTVAGALNEMEGRPRTLRPAETRSVLNKATCLLLSWPCRGGAVGRGHGGLGQRDDRGVQSCLNSGYISKVEPTGFGVDRVWNKKSREEGGRRGREGQREEAGPVPRASLGQPSSWGRPFSPASLTF